MVEDKNIKGQLEKLAQELNGNYTEYSDDTVILTVPIGDSRYQSVKGFIREKEAQKGWLLTFTSTICRLTEHPEVNLKKMLEMNYSLGYAKIAITDEEYLEVVTSMNYELCTEDELRFMIDEAAHTADRLELEITGKDIH